MAFKVLKNKKENLQKINIKAINESFLLLLIKDKEEFLCKKENTIEEKKEQKNNDLFFDEIFNKAEKEAIKNQVSEDLDSIITDIKPDKPKKEEDVDSSRVVDRRKKGK